MEETGDWLPPQGSGGLCYGVVILGRLAFRVKPVGIELF